MGDEYNGELKTTVDVEEQIEDLIGGLGIQRRGGLVAEQHVRVVGQRAGNADALLLPTAKLGRISLFAAFQPHQLNQFCHAGFDFGFRHPGNLH